MGFLLLLGLSVANRSSCKQRLVAAIYILVIWYTTGWYIRISVPNRKSADIIWIPPPLAQSPGLRGRQLRCQGRLHSWPGNDTCTFGHWGFFSCFVSALSLALLLHWLLLLLHILPLHWLMIPAVHLVINIIHLLLLLVELLLLHLLRLLLRIILYYLLLAQLYQPTATVATSW